MPRLYYLAEEHAHDLVASLTEQVFPDSPAFQLRGSEGRHALLSALDQPRRPYYRTLPEKAGALHFSLNKNRPFAERDDQDIEGGAHPANPTRAGAA
ncbi:MAG: hypothetical protein OXI51_13440 [Chloroflexota bacterium]|nr:hypothetical protein [Chloroflexota bacterium]